jgi:hypothetical protein
VRRLLWGATNDAVPKNQGSRMAEPATDDSRPNDFDAHVRDYSGFIRMFKWLAIISFLSAIFVMIIIS